MASVITSATLFVSTTNAASASSTRPLAITNRASACQPRPLALQDRYSVVYGVRLGARPSQPDPAVRAGLRLAMPSLCSDRLRPRMPRSKL
jgi:hypothetical protein